MLELTKVSTTTGLIEYRFSVPPLGAEKIENAVKAILEMAKDQAAVDNREDDAKTYSIEEVFGPKDSAAVLRGFRYRDDLTQKQVADAIGSTQHRISELENGIRKISKKMAERLAVFFKTSPAVFL